MDVLITEQSIWLSAYIYLLNTILGTTYGILTRPGELLAPWAIYINQKVSGVRNKLLLCPYCIFGQLTMWQLILLASLGYVSWLFLPIVIGLTIISIKGWLNNL